MSSAAADVGPLLAGSDAAAEKRWAAMGEEGLDHEIRALRSGVQDLNAQLQGLGVAVSLDDREPDGEAAADLPVRVACSKQGTCLKKQTRCEVCAKCLLAKWCTRQCKRASPQVYVPKLRACADSSGMAH